MPSYEAPICVDCKHLRKPPGLTCDAFPKGIPEEIYTSKFDHHKPYPGDNGIQFELKTTNDNRKFGLKKLLKK